MREDPVKNPGNPGCEVVYSVTRQAGVVLGLRGPGVGPVVRDGRKKRNSRGVEFKILNRHIIQ